MDQPRRKNMTRREFVGLSAGALALLASGCVARPPKTASAVPTTEQVAKSQLLIYQGQKLDSIAASRENSISGIQYVDLKTWSLKVDGLVAKPAIYKYQELLAKFPHVKKVARLDCVEGWGETQLWEGVPIRDVLNASVIKPEAKVVILHAHDGYTTSYPVDYLLSDDRLLVFSLNGVVLTAERGYPLRLAVWDKWGYKWIRWIERLELSADVNYRGYWESRGYSNDGSHANSPQSP
jgi:DMSO/TMAO reductase YedYZ molybdopterin-dependent catalytic subunit